MSAREPAEATRRPPGSGTTIPGAAFDAAVKALASLVTAATLIGFVTLTGGAIVWLRSWSAQLPAERVVIVTPKDDLVVIGALALAVFALAGIGAVLLAYLLDRWGAPSERAILGLTTLGVLGMAVAVAYSGRPEWQMYLLWAGLLPLAAAALGLYRRFSGPHRARTRRAPRIRPWGIVTIALLLVVAALAIAAIRWWLGVMLLVTSALVGLDLLVARATGLRFRWYGVAVFVSVAVFGAVLTVTRTYAAPRFQAAAVVRATDPDGSGIAAIYVAETDERVYLAGVETKCVNGRPGDTPKPGSGRLFWVPRDQVAAVAIGPPLTLGAALVQAPALLDELHEVRAPSPSPAPPGPPPPGPASPPGPPQAGAGAGGPAGGSRPSDAVSAAATLRDRPEPETPRRFLGLVAPACDVPRTPPFHGELVTGSEAFDRAMQFRPWIRFDGRERWRPLAIDVLVRESFMGREPDRHRACNGVSDLQAACRDVADAGDLAEATAGVATPERRTYLDINGLRVGDYCAPGRCGEERLECGECKSSAIYYRVHRANGRLYIDYWWFLRFNHVEAGAEAAIACAAKHKRPRPRCFDHEGDWEGITVVTSADEPYELEFASFAEHDRIARYQRDSLELWGEHPVVYVARGTHAAYPTPCPNPPTRRRSCKQTVRVLGRRLPEGRHDGLGEWERNDDGACMAMPRCLLPFPSEISEAASPWDEWEGSWGNCHRVGKRCVLGGGPESPSNQRRYQNPSCFGTKTDVVCDPAVAEKPAPSSALRGRVSRARS